MAFNAILIAMFAVLSKFSLLIGGVKITFTSLPGIIAAMIFGPIDAFFVGILGAFMEQMLSFGFTATTVLWILPPAIRALTVGLLVKKFGDKISIENKTDNKKPWLFIIICMIAALIASCLNTAVYYIDSKIYGYYNFALIFGVFGVRIINGQIIAIITSMISAPILIGLRKTNLIPHRKGA